MAFVITGSTTTVRVLSQTRVMKVFEISVRTIPEGIEFTYDFPYELWIEQGGPATLDAIVGPVAADVQAIAAQPEVQSVYYSQDTSPSGLLVGYIEAVVQTPSRDTANGGLLTETVDIPIEILGNPEFAEFTWQAQIAAALARLRAAAGLS